MSQASRRSDEKKISSQLSTEGWRIDRNCTVVPNLAEILLKSGLHFSALLLRGNSPLRWRMKKSLTHENGSSMLKPSTDSSSILEHHWPSRCRKPLSVLPSNIEFLSSSFRDKLRYLGQSLRKVNNICLVPSAKRQCLPGKDACLRWVILWLSPCVMLIWCESTLGAIRRPSTFQKKRQWLRMQIYISHSSKCASAL